jgi:acyl carrier protein phosphodiesterase
MNYLAHVFLSGKNKELRIGNFIADSVRGKKFEGIPSQIVEGIILHRHIDTYTDSHPIVRKSKDLIRSNHGHWSGVVMDLYFDYFLAKNWNDYHPQPLLDYVSDFYADLLEYYEILPTKVQRFLPIMLEHNWLGNYGHIKGIDTIFKQMHRRTGSKSTMEHAVEDLVKHEEALEKYFRSFMKDIQKMIETSIK